jgi:arylsulfatase A-like enzyme
MLAGHVRRLVLLPELFVGALALALLEGSAAVHLLADTRTRAPSLVATFTVAAGIVLLPALVGAALATALARTRALRRFQLGACLFFAGGRRSMLGLAVVVHALAFGEALVCGAIAFRRAAGGIRLELAAVMAVSITTALVVAFALGACLVVHALAPAAAWTQRRSPRAARLLRAWAAPLLVAGAGALTIRALLPPDLTPGACAVWVLAVASRIAPVHAWLARRLEGVAGVALLASGLAVGAFGYARLTHLSGRAQLAVQHGPVVGAWALGVARRLADRDGDGYAALLGGGDCDDRDPRVHPGAHDVPGNGRDEDCSGADATSFVDRPFEAPSAALAALPSRPNIVLVHLDAVRPDHVGFTGYARPTTPNLDRFRAGATWFSRAYAPGPSTRASMTAILTGEDASRASPAHDDGTRLALRADVRTVAERLAQRGYDRVGVTIPYVLENVRGIEKGFRVWESAWPADDDGRPRGEDAVATTRAATARLATLGGDLSEPFFLYVHYLCAHQPYATDGRAFGHHVVDLYDATLAMCDAEVGRLLDALDARPDRARTAVVVFSDHGELLGEHGFVGHGTELYEPAVRALVLARVPGLDRPVVDAPVTLGDLAPTILALAGAPRPLGGQGGEGWNLLAVAAAPASDVSSRPLFLSEDGSVVGVHYRSRAVVQGRLKLVRDVTTGIEQLYDLDADPGERTNLRRRLPDDRARLAALLESWSAWVTSD